MKNSYAHSSRVLGGRVGTPDSWEVGDAGAFEGWHVGRMEGYRPFA